MAAVPAGSVASDLRRPGQHTWVHSIVRWLFIGLSLGFLAAVLLAPLATVFVTALGKGLTTYLHSLADPDTAAAIRLTLITAAVVVPLNTVFGLAAAWAIAKFEFRGKSILITLIDLPLAISPVISGMVFVLLFGLHGWFGAWLQEHGLSIVFALPGIMLATMFVTFPYVARELIPLMEQLGNDEEEAAITLGAGGWMTFFRVTLPKVRWGLVYGVVLCNSRAMGEFGAVSVVSGHIRGLTNTMPLHIEILYNEYNFVGACAVA
jgi:sulfate transport system permease protein